MKIKETRMICPATGEPYIKRELVPSVSEKTEKALERHRTVHEIVIDQKAASEAFHMAQARRRRTKQKIGW